VFWNAAQTPPIVELLLSPIRYLKKLNLKLTSPDFENGTLIPKKFTCDGDDINPTLFIENIPAETKSLALINNR